MISMTVKGVPQLVKKLKMYDSKAGGKFSVNIRRAGLFLQRESQKIAPVQTGQLKASAFTRKFGTGWKTHVVVGYNTEYAVPVHEDLNKAHGRIFNVKYAALIASRSQRAAAARKLGQPFNRITDPYFKRKEEEQAKYLEQPVRQEINTIFEIIAGKR